MSAAEKLGALRGDISSKNIFDSPSELLRLTDALPQIVVVVEAAEPFAMEQHKSIRNATIWSQLADALAALDEALT